MELRLQKYGSCVHMLHVGCLQAVTIAWGPATDTTDSTLAGLAAFPPALSFCFGLPHLSAERLPTRFAGHRPAGGRAAGLS